MRDFKVFRRLAAGVLCVTSAGALQAQANAPIIGRWDLVVQGANGPYPSWVEVTLSGSRNFWKLQYFLPAETRGHVKRFIGTHYYFEATGSETTLTKAENQAYTKTRARYAALQEENAVKPVVAVSIAGNTPAPDVSQVFVKEVLPLQTNK